MITGSRLYVRSKFQDILYRFLKILFLKKNNACRIVTLLFRWRVRIGRVFLSNLHPTILATPHRWVNSHNIFITELISWTLNVPQSRKLSSTTPTFMLFRLSFEFLTTMHNHSPFLGILHQGWMNRWPYFIPLLLWHYLNPAHSFRRQLEHGSWEETKNHTRSHFLPKPYFIFQI